MGGAELAIEDVVDCRASGTGTLHAASSPLGISEPQLRKLQWLLAVCSAGFGAVPAIAGAACGKLMLVSDSGSSGGSTRVRLALGVRSAGLGATLVRYLASRCFR